jgi:hypothetical protein
LENQADRQNYREDGTTPFFTFWKDGIKQVSLIPYRQDLLGPSLIFPGQDLKSDSGCMLSRFSTGLYFAVGPYGAETEAWVSASFVIDCVIASLPDALLQLHKLVWVFVTLKCISLERSTVYLVAPFFKRFN